MGASVRDRRIRQHELGHAAYSPISLRVPRGLRGDIVQWVEEARVHWLLRAAGIDLGAPVFTEVADGFLREMPDLSLDAESMTLGLLGLAGTGDFEATIAVIKTLFVADSDVRSHYEGYLAVAESASAMVADSPGRFSTTIRVSKWMREMLSILLASRESGLSLPVGALDAPLSQPEGEMGSWGRLRIESPFLGRRAGAGVRRRVSSASWGFVPLALHRLLLDQRVFRKDRPRTPGPTILIDYSSSMTHDSIAVAKFIAAVPGANIATYSGDGDGGVLRVVARAGRAAGGHLLDPPAGSGNIVDGPALDWLARQPRPRIWVTDGLVTGVGDQFALNLLREALDSCRRRNVHVVASLEDARGRCMSAAHPFL